MHSVYCDKYLNSWSSENGICFQKIFQTTLNKWWEVFCSVSSWWCCGSLSTIRALSEHICSFFPPENQLKSMRNLHRSCYKSQEKIFEVLLLIWKFKLTRDLHDSWMSLKISAVLPTLFEVSVGLRQKILLPYLQDPLLFPLPSIPNPEGCNEFHVVFCSLPALFANAMWKW